MSTVSVSDQVCRFLAGTYDPVTRTYRSPQISPPGVVMGAVRRQRPKRLDLSDYFLGLNRFGAAVGCQIYVRLSGGREIREGFGGATAGMKRVRHDVMMNCMLRGDADYAEDVGDGMYSLLDTIRSYIHTDRTMGSGGIETGGFMVGEGGAPGISWTMSDVVSTAEKSESLLRVMFTADEFIQA